MNSRLLTAVCVSVVACAGLCTAEDPWIIFTDVVITEPMDVENVIILGSGSLTVRDLAEPGFRVTGNLWALADATVRLENSVIQFMNAYHGQFSLVAGERARVEIVGCDYRVPNQVQHGLVAAGEAEMVIEDTNFGDVQLISAETAVIEARRLNGNFEVIVQNNSEMVLADIPRDAESGRLWVWVEFPSGSEAVYTPPMPGYVESWTFPPAGSSGIVQRVRMDRCETFLWPMLIRAGSRLTLRDIPEENWVVVGFFLPDDAEIRGLENGTTYQDSVIEFDRELHLIDASIDTWNLYPQLDSRVVVRDSVVGEILSMDASRVHVENSTVDGSGGFLGARNDSQIVMYESLITSTIEATGDSTIELHHCEVVPYPQDPTGSFTRFGAYDRARLFADQTPVATIPVLGGQGMIGVSFFANPPAQPPSDEAVLIGIAGLFSLDGGPQMEAWRLEAVSRISGRSELIAEGTSNVEQDELGRWTGADPACDHLLRTVLIDSWGRTLVGRHRVDGEGPRVRRPTSRIKP